MRRVGEPEPARQRYSCAEGEGPDPEPITLAAGEARSFVVTDFALHQLQPGAYVLEVELRRPAIGSGPVEFHVEGPA
ncbi:MAG: hypothetical protein AB7N76_00130 [Planctomycetota bacterium]